MSFRLASIFRWSVFFFIVSATLLADSPSLIFSPPTYHGTGCAQGSVAFLATNDAFSFIFSNYLAEKGPGIPIKNSTKNCQLITKVTVPLDYTAEVVSVDYRGFTELERNTASYLFTYFIFGNSQVGSSPIKYFSGPKEFDFFKRDKPYFTARNRCSTGQPIALVLNTSMGVIGSSNRQGVITLDSIDSTIEAKLRLVPCR